MPISGFDHVQIAIPNGGEAVARAFYIGLLGFVEVTKPDHLKAQGGLWLVSGTANLHLGIDRAFAPARKAHPAFLVDDLVRLEARLADAGSVVAVDEPLDGYDRIYVTDPFGNRLELLQPWASRPRET